MRGLITMPWYEGADNNAIMGGGGLITMPRNEGYDMRGADNNAMM